MTDPAPVIPVELCGCIYNYSCKGGSGCRRKIAPTTLTSPVIPVGSEARCAERANAQDYDRKYGAGMEALLHGNCPPDCQGTGHERVIPATDPTVPRQYHFSGPTAERVAEVCAAYEAAMIDRERERDEAIAERDAAESALNDAVVRAQANEVRAIEAEAERDAARASATREIVEWLFRRAEAMGDSETTYTMAVKDAAAYALHVFAGDDSLVGKLPTTQPPNDDAEHDAWVAASARSALHGIESGPAALTEGKET